MIADTILQGDIRQIARTLPAESVHCIVTSPPYYGLRDYGTAEWEGGREDCDHRENDKRNNRPNGKLHGGTSDEHISHVYKGTCPKCGAIRKDAQIGLEATPQEYVDTLVGIFRELRRVLRDDGTVWLNLGDSYNTSPPGNKGFHYGPGRTANGTLETGHRGLIDGLKPKDLIGIPWRVALALQADGWYLRSDIIWAKANPMPESVSDRPTKAHEYVFLLSKKARYYYDAEAIKEPLAESSYGRAERKQNLIDRTGTGTLGKQAQNGINQDHGYAGLASARNGKTGYSEDGTRNRRTVWSLATSPFPGAHFAVFPPDLIRPCILAGCPERVCSECGAPWERVVERGELINRWNRNNQPHQTGKDFAQDQTMSAGLTKSGHLPGWSYDITTTGFRPTCNHYNHLYQTDFPYPRKARKRHQREASGDWWRRVRQRPGLDHWPSEPGIVFDPFLGSGTVAQVAIEEGRRWLGCELSEDYIDLAWDRIDEAMVTKVAGKNYYKTIREKPDSTLAYKQLGLINEN